MTIIFAILILLIILLALLNLHLLANEEHIKRQLQTLSDALSENNKKLRAALYGLSTVPEKDEMPLKNIPDVIAALTAKIAAQKTVADSVAVLVPELRKELQDAIDASKAGGLTDEQVSLFQAIADGIDANSSELQAAVSTNTEVDPNNPS